MSTATTIITPEVLIDIVCRYYELDVDRLTKRIPETGRHYRSKEYATGRRFVYYWLRKNTSMSLTRVGSFMENINHSTILTGIEKLNDEMNLYSSYKKEIFTLNQLIQNAENSPELV